MAELSVEPLSDSPSAPAGITITGLGVGDSLVTLWRSADDVREAVSGYRRVVMNDAAYVTDHYCPLGRPVTYELEVLSGPSGASRALAAPVFIDAAAGVLMDALLPYTAVPIVGERRKSGDIYLRSQALTALEYNADISIFKIMGSDKPMALFGQRMAEMGLDTSLGTRSAVENARLKKLLKSTAQLVFKPLPAWGDLELPGVMHLANAKATQLPVDVMMGGELTWWDIKSDVVQAPAIRVLTATFTWGDVAILFNTWGDKQAAVEAAAAAAGEAPTWLFDLKHPLG